MNKTIKAIIFFALAYSSNAISQTTWSPATVENVEITSVNLTGKTPVTTGPYNQQGGYTVEVGYKDSNGTELSSSMMYCQNTGGYTAGACITDYELFKNNFSMLLTAKSTGQKVSFIVESYIGNIFSVTIH